MAQVFDGSMAHFPGNPQCEITAEGESNQKDRFFYNHARHLVDGLKHFIEKYGIKNTAIQMVGVAVVPEVQSENVISPLIQGLTGAQYISGIDAALPAM